MAYKGTFPVQANRFLRLQVFTPLPSLHFSVHFSLLVISCFYTWVLQCLKLLYTGKEYQSLCKAICFEATTFKVEENSKTFQGLTVYRHSGTFQGKIEFKDFSRTPPKIQGLFKTVRTLFVHINKPLTYQNQLLLNFHVMHVSGSSHLFCSFL